MAEIGTEEEFASQTSWKGIPSSGLGQLEFEPIRKSQREKEQEMGLEGHRIRLPRALDMLFKE